jgi:small multidrug resistance pump
MQWVFLCGAVICEVIGTIFLRLASAGKNAYYAAVAVAYVIAFIFLTLTLNQGLGLGVAYGVWAAAGVALTAIASKIFFKEPLTPVMIGGILAIIGGVLLVELGSSH